MKRLPTLTDAHTFAADLLEPLGHRWLHTQAVAARAERLAVTVPAADRRLLLVAAWWHDIGYAPALAGSGFHPLDGARHLASLGYTRRLSALVAHHSGARYEAAERGLADELAEYELEDTAVADALTCADLTVGPNGEALTFDERLDGILCRYRADSAVHLAMAKARTRLAAQVARVCR